MLLRRLSLVVLVICAAIVSGIPDSMASNVAGGTAAVGLLVGVWISAIRPSPGGRLPWVLIAVGMSLWLFVDIGLDPFGVGEALWLLGYPIFNASFVIMALKRAGGQVKPGLLDGLTLTTAATLTAWQVLIQPKLGTAPSLEVVLLNASYLLGDFIMLAALLFLVLSPGRRGVPTRLIMLSISTALSLELLFTLSGKWASVVADHMGGVGILAYGMCVVAALHPDRDELVSPAPTAVETLHPARVLFLGLAILAVPLIAVTRGDLEIGDRILLVSGTVITTALSLIRFVGAVREQNRAQRALAHQVDHDMLTGLANRRAFSNRLHKDEAGNLTVFYLDLDRFKPINDGYGHAAGDAVLAVVAERLRRSVRPEDLVARLGGDEFAVLCAGLQPAGQQRLADRLAAAVAEPIDLGDGNWVTVGTSIGVASTRDGIDPQALITEADHAMFDAKHSRHRELVGPDGRAG